jgi:peroxiredoxin Q/BCP
VVLAFYPADMTKGCTLEAHKLSSIAPELQKRGVKLFGISVQDVNSKMQFCEKDGITYTLLADAEKSASRDYEVLQPSGVARRTTFVIAPDGKIGALQKEVQPISADQDTLKLVNDVLKKS